MVHVKCSSIAPDRIEAELFGQVRGAHPGAAMDRPGKLELADGGTLFLEDVADLPPQTQGRLLQSLQDGKVMRLGDKRARPIDLRVIAAMGMPVETAIQRERLREDLAFFLNVFPIACRPLRERTEDIPALVSHLLHLSCQRLNLPKPMVTEGAIAKLKRYDWPGNVRELHNVIERAAILSKGGKLIIDMSGLDADGKAPKQILTEDQMTVFQRENIRLALREAGGRVSGVGGAAERLGIRPTTLFSRIRKFGLDGETNTQTAAGQQ